MEHENFPVAGFEFMNEPATDEQKDVIAELAAKAGEPIDRNGKWPSPFTKYDAANMITSLQAAVYDTIQFTVLGEDVRFPGRHIISGRRRDVAVLASFREKREAAEQAIIKAFADKEHG